MDPHWHSIHRSTHSSTSDTYENISIHTLEDVDTPSYGSGDCSESHDDVFETESVEEGRPVLTTLYQPVGTQIFIEDVDSHESGNSSESLIDETVEQRKGPDLTKPNQSPGNLHYRYCHSNMQNRQPVIQDCDLGNLGGGDADQEVVITEIFDENDSSDEIQLPAEIDDLKILITESFEDGDASSDEIQPPIEDADKTIFTTDIFEGANCSDEIPLDADQQITDIFEGKCSSEIHLKKDDSVLETVAGESRLSLPDETVVSEIFEDANSGDLPESTPLYQEPLTSKGYNYQRMNGTVQHLVFILSVLALVMFLWLAIAKNEMLESRVRILEEQVNIFETEIKGKLGVIVSEMGYEIDLRVRSGLNSIHGEQCQAIALNCANDILFTTPVAWVYKLVGTPGRSVIMEPNREDLLETEVITLL